MKLETWELRRIQERIIILSHRIKKSNLKVLKYLDNIELKILQLRIYLSKQDNQIMNDNIRIRRKIMAEILEYGKKWKGKQSCDGCGALLQIYKSDLFRKKDNREIFFRCVDCGHHQLITKDSRLKRMTNDIPIIILCL